MSRRVEELAAAAATSEIGRGILSWQAMVHGDFDTYDEACRAWVDLGNEARDERLEAERDGWQRRCWLIAHSMLFLARQAGVASCQPDPDTVALTAAMMYRLDDDELADLYGDDLPGS